jgi:hypothetical protein
MKRATNKQTQRQTASPVGGRSSDPMRRSGAKINGESDLRVCGQARDLHAALEAISCDRTLLLLTFPSATPVASS